MGWFDDACSWVGDKVSGATEAVVSTVTSVATTVADATVSAVVAVKDAAVTTVTAVKDAAVATGNAIATGAKAVYNYGAEVVKVTKDSACKIVDPNATWEERFGAASNVVGLIPVAGDFIEAGCSIVHTGIKLCNDPANWKKTIAEGVSDVALTACTGPKCLLKPLEKKAMKYATEGAEHLMAKVVQKTSKVTNAVADGFEKAHKNKLVGGVVDETYEMAISSGAHYLVKTPLEYIETGGEMVYDKLAGNKVINSSTLLQASKDQYVGYLRENGQLKTDEKGQPIISEEGAEIICRTYEAAVMTVESRGYKVRIDISGDADEPIAALRGNMEKIQPDFHNTRDKLRLDGYREENNDNKKTTSQSTRPVSGIMPTDVPKHINSNLLSFA